MTTNQALVESIELHHAQDAQESVDILLASVPPEGGSCTRAIFEALIREAFIGGVLAERQNPFESKLRVV